MIKYDSSILQWIDKNHLKTSKGIPFEWTMHSFLIRPMSDWSKNIVIKKSAQIGFSESFGILKALYGALVKKWNIIYTLPTDSFAETFVNTKLNPLLEYNPGLNGVVKGSLAVKEIQNRFIHFRGTYNTKGKGEKAETEKGISISSDLNIHDEMDRSDQNTIEQYSSRLEDSDYGGMWAFSNLTYPGVGCDGLYNESDQKVWTVKCSHCNHYQYLDWIKLGESTNTDTCYVDVANQRYVCSKCNKEITSLNIIQGQWVAKYDKDISGYWMSQLNYAKHTVPELLEKERKTSKQHFYNFILGKAYRGTDVTVERNVIIKNIVPSLNGKKNVAMGVDQGVWKHYVLGNTEGIFEVGKTKDWQVIEEKFNQYNATMVCDALPYPNVPKALIKKYPGRVFMCYYMKDKDEIDIYKFLKGKNRGVVKAQRTKYFDVLVDKFVQGEKRFNIVQRDLDEYIAHWESMSRQDVADAQGIIRGEWLSSNQIDHYAHATLYEDLALLKVNQGKSDVDQNLVKSQTDSGVVITNNRMPNYGQPIFEDQSVDWRYC